MERTNTDFKAGARQLCICLGLLIIFAATVPGAESADWVMGVDTNYQDEPFIGRYDQWLVGHPEQVMIARDTIGDSNLGNVCTELWEKNTNDAYDFSCEPSPDEITGNANTYGYYIGTLNKNAEPIAQCFITNHDLQLCDTGLEGGQVCKPYFQCHQD
jgi:hypothetical protein